MKPFAFQMIDGRLCSSIYTGEEAEPFALEAEENLNSAHLVYVPEPNRALLLQLYSDDQPVDLIGRDHTIELLDNRVGIIVDVYNNVYIGTPEKAFML